MNRIQTQESLWNDIAFHYENVINSFLVKFPLRFEDAMLFESVKQKYASLQKKKSAFPVIVTKRTFEKHCVKQKMYFEREMNRIRAAVLAFSQEKESQLAHRMLHEPFIDYCFRFFSSWEPFFTEYNEEQRALFSLVSSETLKNQLEIWRAEIQVQEEKQSVFLFEQELSVFLQFLQAVGRMMVKHE